MKPSLAASLVAEGASLRGDFSFVEEVLVAGTVNGSVIYSGDEHGIVKILDGGSLTGEINSPTVEIFGRVEASITSSHNVTFGPNAHFTGTVQYRKLSVCAGAIINGALIPLVKPDNDASQVSQGIEQAKLPR
tara:strand:- start:3928 stop:4326 length:399 start_codon:yes stop_codon:yes gene_type:complete